MTLAPSTRVSSYDPVVSTTDFLVGFPIFDDADLTVYVDGVETAAFSVTSTYVDGVSTDATVVLDTAVSGVNVAVYGTRTPESPTSYIGASPNLARLLELDVDRLAAVQQEQSRDFERSLKLPFGDAGAVELPADRALKYLFFDAYKNPTMSSGVSSVAVSAAMEPVVGAATLALARTQMGLGSTDTPTFGNTTITSTSPQLNLIDSDVNTDAIISSNNSGSLRIRADVNAEAAGSQILLEVDGSEKLRVQDDGSIGIGGANYGSAGHVLRSAGSGAAPAWSGGLPALVEVRDLSTQNGEFTGFNNTKYSSYFFLFEDVNNNLRVQTSADGVTWDSGASDYSYSSMQVGTAGTVTGNGSTGASWVDITSGLGCADVHGEMQLLGAGNSAAETTFLWRTRFTYSTSNLQTGQGRRESAAVVLGLRFTPYASFSKGKIYMYGMVA